MAPTAAAPPRAAHHAGPPHPSLDRSRFVPGAVLDKRYRIVGLLGRGGMGEVYRADDLKLGQPVALKFLPEGLERDEQRLSRLLNEVRTARQVTHPNVCRVFDIDEIPSTGSGQGQHYLSMEYVDGEDLSSLLRRIGRLPRDKATQIARQLCAGVQAAHERGILHRDLKPANVMIDGRGQVKITDFGLAELEETIQDGEIRSGTPAYMAPEQLAGKEVTVRSDIYALGLVLYELFTGKPAFEAAGPTELVRMRSVSTPTSPSDHVEGFDPAVEQVILGCLAVEPRDRPASALAVAAALPGGDPLAAAMAAGETPSPELVAEAGARGGSRPWVAWGCLALLVAGLAAVLYLPTKVQLTQHVPLPKPPAALEERARTILENLGYDETPADSARGFTVDHDYLNHIEENDLSPQRWSRLAGGHPAAVSFFYRESPSELHALGVFRRVGPDNPPHSVAGLLSVWLDGAGTLIKFVAVPPELVENEEPAAPIDWTSLLGSAGLDEETLRPAGPRWTPPVNTDQRAAWEGTYAGTDDLPLRIEAGAFRGKPVYFEALAPWRTPTKPSSDEQGGFAYFVFVLVGGGLLARRNFLVGRGDLRGATLVGIAYVVLCLPSLLPQRQSEELGYILLEALSVSVLYVAIEPYARRLWPRALVSWIRLLDGRLRDPLLGRDLLIGGVFGIASAALAPLFNLASERLGLPYPLEVPPITALLGPFWVLEKTCVSVMNGLLEAFTIAFILVVLRIALRRQWLANVVALVVVSVVTLGLFGGGALDVVVGLTWLALILTAFLRFGFLVVVVAATVPNLFYYLPLTNDFSAWYSTGTIAAVLVVLGLGLYGLFTSMADRPLSGNPMAATGPRT